jgi:5-enolpyruvylshikimate-3-phosphate synthase/chorismate mutase
MAVKKNHNTGSLRKELADVDSELMRLLARRCELFEKHLQERRAKSQSLSDPEMEKGLWQVWQRESKDSGLNEKLLRRAFHLVNGLAYDRTERPREKEFLLYPRTEPVAVDLPGPREREPTRMWLALAAASGSSLRLEQAMMNDALFELIRALQQAGARISWDASALWTEASQGAGFNGKSVYVGGDTLNLYLLVFLAALEPGSCKLTGSTRARLADLGPLFEILPRLGARGVSILPGNWGLPMRLESSGNPEDEILLPDSAPREMGLALVLCLGFFHAAQRAIRITWNQDSGWRELLEPACEVLAASGADFGLEHGCLRLEPGTRQVPMSPELPLDVEFGSCLLALPRFVGGWTRLKGGFAQDSTRRDIVFRLLRAFGLAPEEDGEAVIARAADRSEEDAELDLRGAPWAAPLAASLALAAGGGLLHLPRGDGADFAAEAARELGAEVLAEGSMLRVASGPAQSGERLELVSPDSGWSLALALIALVRPGIVLRNPGELHGDWPDFWTIYNGLPRPQDAFAAREEKGRKAHGSRRRRYIVD